VGTNRRRLHLESSGFIPNRPGTFPGSRILETCFALSKRFLVDLGGQQVTELDKSQSLSISGTPGISEIPGLNDLTSKDLQKNYATLVIVMTPHVVRGPQAAGHTAMMRVDSDSGAR